MVKGEGMYLLKKISMVLVIFMSRKLIQFQPIKKPQHSDVEVFLLTFSMLPILKRQIVMVIFV